MGKSGEDVGGGGTTRPMVKRQVVSARSPSLEVVSQDKFARRLQGMSGCVNCQRERGGCNSQGRGTGVRPYNNKNTNSGKQRRRGKQGRRRPTKANTPIIVHIKDTLRSSRQRRQRSLDTDSDVSSRSVDEESTHSVFGSFGDVSSIPEFIPQYMLHQSTSSTPLDFVSQASHSTLSQRREKSKKNLTTFISVLEKAHHKDSYHSDSNLAHSTPDRSKLCHVLNNAVSSREKSPAQPRSIADCDNVEVICNDLHKNGKGLECGEETDSLSDRSSVSSSSDAVSDCDNAGVEESGHFEFTPEELQSLAEYTTGYPLYRYDCPPSECPECLSAWYYHQMYQFEGCPINTAPYPEYVSSRHRTSSHSEPEHDTTLEASDDDESEHTTEYVIQKSPRRRRRRTGSTSSTSSFEYSKTSCQDLDSGWSRGSRQLWDIDISHNWRRGGDPGQEQAPNPCPDSVFLDLTGTDVSISVYYHHSLLQDQDARAALLSSSSTTVLPLYTPTSAPLFSFCYQTSPVYGLSLPLSFFSDHVLPKIAMVPPHELKKYTSSQLPHREWAKNEGEEPDQTHPAALFTVMCYNVLCDKYCTRQQYGYCPTWALNWDYRKKGIMDHILEFQADIISLQEVETDQFYSFFRPELTRHGYNGIFLPKSRARTMAAQDRKKVDGCAIFYKKDKFHLVDHKPVEFNQLAMANAEGNDDMLNRVMTKDNIGLIALLQTKPPVFDNAGYPHPGSHTQQYLMVATAHIHWDPEYSDVKMVQTMMLMSEMLSFVEKITREQSLPFSGPYNCNSVPLVLCGDLNSLPDSGVIEFLSRGRVAFNHEDFKDNAYDQVLKKLCTGDKLNIYHDFHLKRAYGDVMPVTNYTYDFKGIIDYIYFTKGRLRVLQQLGPYDEAWFRLNKVLGCPHPHIPSDHFSLVVLFEMPILPPMPNRHLPPPGSKPR